jgi:hypothetical protein
VFSIGEAFVLTDLFLPPFFFWLFWAGCEDACVILSILSPQLFPTSASHEANLAVPALYLVPSARRFSRTESRKTFVKGGEGVKTMLAGNMEAQ